MGYFESNFGVIFWYFLTSDLEDGLSKALHVAGGDTSDRDAAVLGGIDRVLNKVVSSWLVRDKIG